MSESNGHVDRPEGATTEEVGRYRGDKWGRIPGLIVRAVPVSEIVIEGRARKDYGDLDGLAESIREHGLLHPPVLDKKTKRLLAGERRLRACQSLGMESVPCRLIESADLPEDQLLAWQLKVERDENETHKPFTASERAELARRIEAALRGARPGAPAADEKPPEPKKPGGRRRDVRDEAAKAAGFGGKTEYLRAQEVIEQGTPELVQAMDAGAVSMTDAAALAKEPPEVQRQALEALEAGVAVTAARAAAAVKAEGPALTESARVRDEKGRELPGHLVETFAVRTTLAGMIQRLGKLQNELKNLKVRPGGGGEHVRVQELVRDLDNVQRGLRYAKPHVVCPACDGAPKTHGDRCEQCGSRRYLTELEYDALGRELKTRADSFGQAEVA